MPAKKPAVKTSAARNSAVGQRLKAKGLKGEPGRINKETGLLDLSIDTPLTQMQRDFAREWAAGNTIKNAAQRAGYKNLDVTPYVLAKHPKILLLFQEEKAKWEKTTAMTRQRVIDGLLDSIAMAQMLAEPSTMVSGWREIGKLCGHYEPIRVQVDISGKLEVSRLNQLSDDELLAMIDARSKLLSPPSQSAGDLTDDTSSTSPVGDQE